MLRLSSFKLLKADLDVLKNQKKISRASSFSHGWFIEIASSISLNLI